VPRPAPLQSIVETALYGEDLEALETFYTSVLGLTVLVRDYSRHVFLQVGPATVLLLFKPSATLEPGDFPVHGTRGPGHTAFGITADQLGPWRTRLGELGVPIEKELTWPKGGRSLYFRDPAGNSVELITPGVWGLPAGW
jgi:catechol 2,3-dioxygenase-like lactoylglutathione lyase family enzyme